MEKLLSEYPSAMVDIETLATISSAKILSISAVAFDEFDFDADIRSNPSFDILLELDGQDNRFEDPKTVEWWGKQSQEVIEKIFAENGRTPVIRGLRELATFLHGKSRLWSKGAFDQVILEDIFKENKMFFPWNYWTWKDYRTMLLLGKVPAKTIIHDSLDDCYNQIDGLLYILKNRNIQSFEKRG
jgi:hypothetical protein